MMKNLLSWFLLLFCVGIQAQEFRGQVYMKEDSYVFLNHIYVTNISQHKTVLTKNNGHFIIEAKIGDIVRFTSILTDRKEYTITQELLDNPNNFIRLSPMYHEIQEVVIRFKPTGNLKKDVMALKSSEKSFEIAKMIGLPEPKGDGNSPTNPPVALAGGGLTFSVDTIFDLVSGEHKKKMRLYQYEKMSKNVAAMKSYFGVEYFQKLKIPANLIDNFLEFVYTSDNISNYIDAGNLEGTRMSIEKYLPIYLKRLESSKKMSLQE